MNLVVGILVVIVAALWFVGFLDRVVMPLISRSGVQVNVPDLRNIKFEQADSLCSKLQLEIVKARTRPDDRLGAGVIVDQFPVAGSVVKPGRRIEVVVTDQAGLIACPGVVGRSVREAMISADSCGLVIRENAIRYAYSEQDPEGVVVSQTPPPFTGVLKGAELRLTVSLGGAPVEMIVPNLVGRNFEEASFLLIRYQLHPGDVISFPDRHSTPGIILSQDPPAGSTLPDDKRVNLRVAIRPVGMEEEADTTQSPAAEETHEIH